ncbi:MAG: hypothetical protein ACYDAJ_00305 [Nitrosotalea sp.]
MIYPQITLGNMMLTCLKISPIYNNMSEIISVPREAVLKLKEKMDLVQKRIEKLERLIQAKNS